MSTIQTIAIIGANNGKGRLASLKLATRNTRLLLADENKEDLFLLKNEIDARQSGAETEVMDCMKEAGWEADIIVLALNWQSEREIFTLIKPFITGKTVISFSKDNNCLLPYSHVIPVKDDDPAWPEVMADQLKNDF